MNFKSILCASLTVLAAFGIGCGGKSDEDEQMMQSSAPAAAKKAIDAATAGSVSGKISFQGTAPKMNKIDMGAEAVCAALHSQEVRDQSVTINSNGTLKNVVIQVKKGLEEYSVPPMGGTPMINQTGCLYEPHVLLMSPGALQIKSSDKVLHNVNAQAKINKGFNRGQPMPSTFEEKFMKPEIVPLKCDVHPWMRAYVAVVENGIAAVTGDDGSFKLNGLPAGQYTIEAWHEKFGLQEMTVTVESGKTAEANFTFGTSGT